MARKAKPKPETPTHTEPDASPDNNPDTQDSNTAVMSLEPDVTNAGAHADDIGYESQISVSCIYPSDDNPRKWFDEGELQSLADSLLKHGQLQNLTVRPLEQGSYELIGGERRYRAALLAGLSSVRCRVIQVDDATAIELRGIENYRRSQLNAIEEGIWFEQMLSTGRFNQATLAQHLGITQSQVSNRLRLLRLPDEWQLLLVKGILPPTQARSIVPWVDRPTVLADVMERITATTTQDGVIPEIAGEWLERTLWTTAKDKSRGMELQTWDGPRFEVTDAIRKELDVQACRVPWTDEPVERAFNVSLWDRLQDEWNAARKSAQDNDTNDDADDPIGPDEEEPAKPKSKDRSDLNDYRLERHFERHFAQFLASRIKPETAIWCFFQSLVFSDGAGFLDWLTRTQDLQNPDQGWSTEVSWKAVQSLTPKNLNAQLTRYLQETWSEGNTDLDLQLMDRVADALNVNPLSKWVPDAELLELCSDSQLRELFTDGMASAKSVAKWGRERLLKESLRTWPAGYVPVLLMPKALTETPDQPAPEYEEADDDESDDE